MGIAGLQVTLLAVCVALVLAELVIPAVAGASLGTSGPVRAIVAVALVSPLGFLMGMPFPTGLGLAGSETRGLIAWGWAVNSGLSVFGSALGVAMSTAYGFAATAFVSIAAYASALVAAVALNTLPGRRYRREAA